MSISVGTFTFDNALAKYGEELDTLSSEIRNDLIRAISDNVFSNDFAREFGIGIESLENEAFNPIASALYKAQIMIGIQAYNAGVSPDRQVITSQDLMDIQRGDANHIEELYINIRYLELRSVGSSSPTLQTLLAPLLT